MRALIIGVIVFVCAGLNFLYAGDIDTVIKSKALAHYIVAVADDFNGRSVEAIKEYERSIAFNGREPLPHLRLAAYYIRLGLTDKALKQLKEVVKIDPNNAQAHYFLGLLYSSQKKFDLAAAEYEAILKSASQKNPGDLEIYTYLAQLYFSQGKYPQAINQFERILELEPKNTAALYYLGSSYLETKQRSKAQEYFKKTLAVEPEHDGALNSLAFMYAQDGVNLNEALKMARKAVVIDSSNGAYYDTLGWVLFKNGFNAEALIALQKALVYVQDAVIYDHIGDVYQAVNEFALADWNWQKSLELDSNQAAVKAKVQAIKKLQAFKQQK